MRFTVREALETLAEFNGPAGSCWDAPSNLKRLNEARRLIYQRVDCEGTMEWGCIEMDDCSCIYLPPHLESVREAWIADRPILVRDQSYMSLDNVGRQQCGDCRADQRVALAATGIRRPVVRTPDFAYGIRVVGDCCEEDEPELTFHVRLNGGEKQSIKITAGSGLDDDGNKVSHGEMIRDVTGVVKDVTPSDITVWAISPLGDREEFLAKYPAGSVNPRFTQMRVVGCRSSSVCALVVWAKKTPLPLVNHDDLVDIESLEALVFAYQALNARQIGDDDMYVSKIQLMEEQLEEQDQNLQNSDGSLEMYMNYPNAGGIDSDVPGYMSQ